MGKRDLLKAANNKNKEARGTEAVLIPEDAPVNVEVTSVVEKKEEAKAPVKEPKAEPVHKEKAEIPKTKASAPKSTNDVKVVEPKVNKKKEASKYEFNENTTKKRVNIGLPNDLIKYLKFKSARTGAPQYKLVTSILADVVTKVEAKELTYKAPELDRYRVRLNTPGHYAVDLPIELERDLKQAASILALTATQFYNFALTEYMESDKDFEF